MRKDASSSLPARLVREDRGARGRAVGRARVEMAPAQHVEGRVYVALGGEVQTSAHVAQRRAHVVGQPVVELVHPLLLVRDGVHRGEQVAPQLGQHRRGDLEAHVHLRKTGWGGGGQEAAGDARAGRAQERGGAARGSEGGRGGSSSPCRARRRRTPAGPRTRQACARPRTRRPASSARGAGCAPCRTARCRTGRAPWSCRRRRASACRSPAGEGAGR